MAMGHEKSMQGQVDSRKQDPWSIVHQFADWESRETALWVEALKQWNLAWLGQVIGSALANWVMSANAANVPYELGAFEIRSRGGLSHTTVTRALAKLRLLAELPPGLILGVEGVRGGDQGSILIQIQVPLPDFGNMQSAHFKGSKNMQSAHLVGENVQVALPKCANCTPSSTSTFKASSKPYPPSPSGREGQGGGEGQGVAEGLENLSLERKGIFEALVDLGSRPEDAHRAAKRTALAKSPERLRTVLGGLELLLAALAEDKKITHPHAILARRVEDNTAFGLVLRLRGKVQDLEATPAAAKAPARPVAAPVPGPAPTTDGAALEAWERIQEALREALPEQSYGEWVAPLRPLGLTRECGTPVLVVGSVSLHHRLWVEGTLADEWSAAIAASGLPGLRVVINEIARKVAF